MRVIINSDDLGASQAVNDSTFELMERRRITSATLMVNGPAAEVAVRRLRAFRHCSFGVHLVLTEFRPLTAHPGLAEILNPDGTFSGKLRRENLSRSVQQAVYHEWRAQIERALKMEVPISHLDGHHHCHTEPQLFFALKKVQKEFGIRKVRLTRNVYDAGEKPPWKLKASKLAWNAALRYWGRTVTTDGFCSAISFYRRQSAELGSPESIELMCHAGGKEFEDETELLRGGWGEELSRSGCLISYNEL